MCTSRLPPFDRCPSSLVGVQIIITLVQDNSLESYAVVCSMQSHMRSMDAVTYRVRKYILLLMKAC